MRPRQRSARVSRPRRNARPSGLLIGDGARRTRNVAGPKGMRETYGRAHVRGHETRAQRRPSDGSLTRVQFPPPPTCTNCQSLRWPIASRRRLQTAVTAPTAMAGTNSARVLGSGTTESVPTYDPVIDSVVELVDVIVPVTVASPVAPAKSPVPPVNMKSPT
jgi:hypothetical protein